MTKRERAWLLPPMSVLLSAGILLGRNAEHILPLLAGGVLCAAAVIIGRNRTRFIALLALTACIGAVAGQIAWHPVLPEGGLYRVSGIVSDELRSADREQYRTVLTNVTLNGEPVRDRFYWSFYPSEMPENLIPGVRVEFTGNVYHPSGPSNPDGYDFREDLLRRNITVGVSGFGNPEISASSAFSLQGWTAYLRYRITLSLKEVMGDEAGGYAATMLFGIRTGVSGEDRAAFAKLGIAHVLAVSGFHVGVLVAGLAALLKVFGAGPRVRFIVSAIILAVYTVLCGMSQPVIRASLLVLLGLYGRILKQPRTGLHLLSACWILMLLFSPVQITGASFLLSFGAMYGLVLVTPFLAKLIRPSRPVPRRLWNILTAGIGAQLGVLLPELYFFQTLPVLSLLINVPFSFVITFMISVYWLILLCLPVPGLNVMLGYVGARVTAFVTNTVRALSSASWISLWTRASTLLTCLGVLLLFIALCSLFRMKAPGRLLLLTAGLAVTVLSVLPVHHTGTEYIQFSVGSADAALLWDEDTTVVIDTGNGDGVLAGYLHRKRVTPDAVILTHLHSDHTYGIADLLDDGIPIRVCYLPEGATQCVIHPSVTELIERLRASGTEIRTLSRGDSLPLPSGEITVLWPEKGRVRSGQEANMYSLAMRVRLHGVTMLQAGDLDGRYEMYAAEPADLLKIAHHGSASSSSEAFIAAVSPQLILLSCNGLNRVADVRERIPDIPVFATPDGGALTVHFTDSGFSAETFLSVSEGGV
ncbi:MAG: ComEC/Rec2 family competence protein [Clostridia bacterium]|nr:ComEC/Rec2 family competence protein [Clostridia bacterium]